MAATENSTTPKPKRSKPAQRNTRVLIAAASSLVRSGLARLIEHQMGIEVAGTVTLPFDVARTMEEIDPEVLLLYTENASTIEVGGLAQLRMPTVIVLEGIEPDLVSEMLAKGAHAVLVGTSSADELSAAIHAAAAGLLTISSELADLVRQALRSDTDEARDASVAEDADAPEHLTGREREVLEMMMEGLSNKEIAAHLNVSVHTVKFHISSVMGKLGASSRTEATTIGLRRGLITI